MLYGDYNLFSRITKAGGHQYVQLVGSFRNDSGRVRTHVVANLGRLDQIAPKQLDPLINGLNRAMGRAHNTSLEVIQEFGLSFGDVIMLHELWQDLGIDKVLKRALRSSRREFDVETLIRAMVFNRLCDPASKLGCLRWLETVAMPSMPDTVTHQHLLRSMDALVDNADVVEKALTRQIRPLVDQVLSIVFYDLTTVRIHGEGKVEADIRAYDMNKETGGVARQFVPGVVQSADGLPLMHTVHPGNVSETKTLQGMLQKVLARFPVQRIILVADCGLLSLDNIGELSDLADQGGCRLEFILAVPARRYADLTETFGSLAFDDAGLTESTFAGHRLIVANDPVRAKEQTDRRRARIRELKGLAEKMAAKLDAQDKGKTARGRRTSDRGAYNRFTRAVAEAKLSRFIRADLQANRFYWYLDEQAVTRAELFDGKLALLTNTPDLTPAETVLHYKALADIERGFRVLKSDIEIAPVHHRLPDRIRAHALICFLALVLYRVMRMRLKAGEHSASPCTTLDILSRIQKHTAHIGDHTFNTTSKTTQEQLDLFDALNLPRPT